MLVNHSKKNKIELSDYNYRRDIENRILMSNFSTFDVEVLEEILNGSIKIRITDLATDLDSTFDELYPTIEKLSKTGLLKIQSDTILVNKEMRKYYEFQILKFDDTFRPDMEFLQHLLRKVPIHSLPNWYSIPRSSDDIFGSIVEKFFITPKTYQNYMTELCLDDRILEGIVNDVYSAPDHKVRSRALREKYELSREEFEVHLLHLEFNFLCFLSYNRVDNDWKEVVTPIHEWTEYGAFVEASAPPPIEDTEKPIPFRDTSFPFVKDMSAVLKIIQEQSLTLDTDLCLSYADVKLLMLQCENMPTPEDDVLPLFRKYFSQVIEKLCEIQLAYIYESELSSSPGDAGYWLQMSPLDQAMFLLRHPRNFKMTKAFSPTIHTDRNVRSVEKSLATVNHSEWIYHEDFLKGMLVTIGDTDGATLIKKGRRWKYEIPIYNDDEKEFIKATLFERLFQVGIVETGTHKGKDCFHVTKFGLDTAS
ncbi:MAG: putative transcriptional regulator [Halioglobus sp.]|jgi:predicted transcriptional regulator